MAKRFRSWLFFTLLAGFVVPTISAFGYILYEVKTAPPESETLAVGRGLPATSALSETLVSYLKGDAKETAATGTEPWSSIYPVTVPMQLGTTSVEASVADSWPERIQGLSDTPYLPEEVVKFFVFDAPAYHSIWMKDMQYAIDIVWVDAAGQIVHIAKNVSPDTYPETFSPATPALYVIEAAAGFADRHGLTVGTTVTLPVL